MKKPISIVFCLIFTLMLLVPLAFTNTEEGAVSDVDGRILLAKPAFSTEGYSLNVEAWFKDRLGFRDAIINAHAVSNDRIFGELINPLYQYGKNGQIFVRIHNNIEYCDYHKQFAEMVSDMQKYCESRGSKFYYVFNPEKESVYRRDLPEGVNYNDSWVDRMLEEMDKLDVNYIDLRKVLIEQSYDENVFNRKYDASAWNHNGAFYGMRTITESIHNDIPEVKILEKNEYTVSSTIVEKLLNSNQVFNEEVPQYTLNTSINDITADYSTELVRSKTYPYFQVIKNDSEEAAAIERMLVFEDDLYAPFALARAKETAIVICLQNAVSFDYYYNVFNPEVVVFENMEHVVNDTYFSQASMESADNNPAILENYPKTSFQERKDQLLSQADEEDNDVSAVIIQGQSIDRVFISRDLKKARYAYLITKDRVIDLKDNEHGVMTASVRHGDFAENTTAVLYYIEDNHSERYSTIPVVYEKQSIINQESQTENMSYNNREKKYFVTSNEDVDSFSYTALQLFNNDITKWFEDIGSSSTVGTVDGGYCHKLPTGEYKLLLRAGSNNNSEWTTFSVFLVEGQTYWFTYTVEEFSQNRVVFSEFRFLEPKTEYHEE